jgi:hypothetical protein
VIPSLAAGGVEGCLATLLEAAAAADDLGLDTTAVRSLHDEASGRLGFPADAYVLALVGGTGVGKSSLLNALAGSTVSLASVRRPTTSEPVAWVPEGGSASLAPLLEWLGVSEVREHTGPALANVAILDLPDMDSVARAHRDRVETLLPRVDAVAWVTDPEKYHDAVLHDAFLRAWLPRLERQAIVLNKADRLAPDDRERLRRDLEADVAVAPATPGRPRVPVLVVSAASDAAASDAPSDSDRRNGADLAELRGWLAGAADAKAIVRSRVASTAVDLARDLAARAGIDPERPERPFLPDDQRRRAIEAATAATLGAVDLPGLERQAVAATRARARARGTGPMGIVTALVYRLSGRQAARADPERHLLGWRGRASLAPAVEALRAGLTGPLRDAPAAVRPALAASLDTTALRSGLEGAVDRAIARRERLEPPDSRWWTLIGALQTLTTGAIAVAVAWVILWVLTRVSVDGVVVPVLGRVPAPLVALVGALVVGYLLARVIGLHAGWLGRRWARRLRAEVAGAVEREVTDHALAPLDGLEDARRRLWRASRAVVEGCRGRVT